MVELPEDDADTVDAMLNFLYRHNYDEKKYTKDRYLFNVKVHDLAEKYLIPSLKRLAGCGFHGTLDQWVVGWQSLR